jgi:phage terminase small subunit
LLIRSVTGDARINPLQRACDRAADAMVRYASEFGFTPAARARIAAGIGDFTPPGGSKFSDLIA